MNEAKACSLISVAVCLVLKADTDTCCCLPRPIIEVYRGNMMLCGAEEWWGINNSKLCWKIVLKMWIGHSFIRFACCSQNDLIDENEMPVGFVGIMSCWNNWNLTWSACHFNRYEECKEKLVPFLKKVGFNPKKDIHFMPCSGLTGANLKEQSEFCPWYM